MNDHQANQDRMARTTCQFCDNNTAATAAIPSFPTALANAKSKLLLIDGLDQIALQNSKGITIDVNASRKIMSDIAFRVGNSVSAYAHSVHNTDLENETGIPRSRFDKMKKDEVDDYCELIRQRGTTYTAESTPFGLNPADLANLASALLVYQAAISSPRQKQISINTAKSQIDELLRQILDDDFAGQMDKMVNTLKASNPTFYTSYFEARVILDLGHTIGKIRGKVTDLSNNTLNGVLFTVKDPTSGTIIGQSTTHDGGVFGVSNLDGNYDLSWIKDGFKIISEPNVHVGPGKELKRKIKMEPI